MTDQHGGTKQLVGLRDDHHDRMACSGTRSVDNLVPVGFRDNKNA